MSGEVIGYCVTQLAEAGALDVFTTAIQMKKNRPGVTLTVLCRAGDVERLEAIIFRETTTLGVRRWPVSRHKLERRLHRVTTPWGEIDGKLAIGPDQPPSFSPEFESCRRVAAERGVPLTSRVRCGAQGVRSKDRLSTGCRPVSEPVEGATG